MTELLRKPVADVYKVTAVGNNEKYTQEPTVWGGGDRTTVLGDDTGCSMKYGELEMSRSMKVWKTRIQIRMWEGTIELLNASVCEVYSNNTNSREVGW